MLPKKLKMQAFASYAEAAEIDFEKLDSLFLICGETGAGKTAVLDAVMYALYGESSGGDRDDMRCRLPAAENIPTEVEFTFSAGGKLFTFTRSITIAPRSKKLTERQDCFYYEEDGTRRAFFENPKQTFVRAKAEELTGLTAEQFRQVIILPQGKFERLLTSDSKEKETILSTLFGAEKYTKLSDKLSEKAEMRRKSLALEENALKTLLAAENAETPEQLAEELSRLKAERDELVPRLEEAKERLSEARKRLTAAEVLSGKFRELAEAEKRIAALNAGRDGIETARARMRKHENASEAKPEKAAFAAAETALSERKKQLGAAEKNLSEAEAAYSEAFQKRTALSEREDENAAKSRELTVLGSLENAYGKISVYEGSAKKLSAELAEREKYQAAAAEKLKNAAAEIARLADMRERITAEYSRKLPVLAEKKAALEKGAEAEKRLKKYTEALEQIRRKIASLEAEAERLDIAEKSAERVYDGLYADYLSNAAAKLSSGLKEGMPCPVCGSTAHPSPAVHRENAVTEENVMAARDEFEAVKKARADKLTEISAERARIPAAEDCIAAERYAVEETGYTAEALQETSLRYAEAVRQNDMLTGIDKKIGELTALKENLELRRNTEEERLAELKNSLNRAEADLSALRERLDPRFPDLRSYTEYSVKLRAETEDFLREKLAAERNLSEAEKRKIAAAAEKSRAEKEYDAAGKSRAEAEKTFLDKLAALGMPVWEYEKSLLDGEEAVRLAEAVKRYDLDLHAADERLKALKTELDGKAPPPAAEIRAAAEEAEAALSELSGKTALAEQRLKRLEKLSAEYSARFAAAEKERMQSDKLTAFARFMHGDKGISFTRYVLSIMLSLVAEEANRILAEIRGGKFRLAVKTELAANSKQGLDLEVENITADSSVRYGVKNLSGGEKFLISLALSLGLSAVARSRNGGIEIEAMFIDEGFGSLDPDSLREAVSILCGLAPGRNTIGIISHVEELKNVIPCGVTVTKNAEGCSKISVK